MRVEFESEPETEVEQQPNLSDKSSSGHDLDEDELYEIELQRLQKSGGQAAPLWHSEPEFQGMTRATRMIALRSRVVGREESGQ